MEEPTESSETQANCQRMVAELWLSINVCFKRRTISYTLACKNEPDSCYQVFHFFMVYLIGPDTLYIDKLETAFQCKQAITMFIAKAHLQHLCFHRTD